MIKQLLYAGGDLGLPDLDRHGRHAPVKDSNQGWVDVNHAARRTVETTE